MATITCWRQPGAAGTSRIMDKFDEATLIPSCTYDLFYYWSNTLTLVVCRDTS